MKSDSGLGSKAFAELSKTPHSFSVDIVIRRNEPKVRPPLPGRPPVARLSAEEAAATEATIVASAVPEKPERLTKKTEPAVLAPVASAQANNDVPKETDSQPRIMSAAKMRALNSHVGEGPSLAELMEEVASSSKAGQEPRPVPRARKPQTEAAAQEPEERPPPVKLPGMAPADAEDLAQRKPRPNATTARSGPVPLPRKPAQ